MDGPWEYIDRDVVSATVDTLFGKFQKAQVFYRNKIKRDLIETPICRFNGFIDDTPPQQPAPLKLCRVMLDEIKNFNTNAQIVFILRNPDLFERHWISMSEAVGEYEVNKFNNSHQTFLVLFI